MDFIPGTAERVLAAARENIQTGGVPLSALRRIEALSVLARKEAENESADAGLFDEFMSAAVIEAGRHGYTLSASIGSLPRFCTDVRIFTRAAIWLIFDGFATSCDRRLSVDMFMRNDCAILRYAAMPTDGERSSDALLIRAARHGAELCGGALLTGKTHFEATSVLSVKAYECRAGRPVYPTFAELLSDPCSVVRIGLSGL